MTDPDDSLRVSDAERDVTLRMLGDHAAVGRLTLDELEERSSRALAAKTRGELATLTSDLPLGGNTEIGVERLRPGAPRVVIRAYNLMGGATIFRVPPQARGRDLREARRMAKAAGRGQLPAPD